jgi:hypothetical protein
MSTLMKWAPRRRSSPSTTFAWTSRSPAITTTSSRCGSGLDAALSQPTRRLTSLFRLRWGRTLTTLFRYFSLTYGRKPVESGFASLSGAWPWRLRRRWPRWVWALATLFSVIGLNGCDPVEFGFAAAPRLRPWRPRARCWLRWVRTLTTVLGERPFVGSWLQSSASADSGARTAGALSIGKRAE